jgi:hypothetical protein
MAKFSGSRTIAGRVLTASLLIGAGLATWIGEAAAQPAPPAPAPPPAGPTETGQKPPAGQPPAAPPQPGAGAAQPAPPPEGTSPGSPLGSPLAVPASGAAEVVPGGLPPAGKDTGTTPPPPGGPPRAFANEGGPGPRGGDDGPPLAGWHDRFYLRDRNDHFRFYPGVFAAFDLQTWVGPGTDGDARSAGGAGLPPRFVMRRMRLDLAGELLSRWSYQAQFDLDVRGTNGTAGLPAGDVVSAEPAIRPANVYIDYNLCDCLHLTFGQVRAPVGLENRTNAPVTVSLERTIATRSFIAPGQRETGIMAWGSLASDLVSYELMVGGGDGDNRPQVDGSFDFMGRIAVRPFSSSVEFLEKLQIGIAARHGNRDQYGVGYDVYTVTTGQGLVLWSPISTDSLGREIHVIPSGAQNQIGGELRAPLGPFDLRAEVHYVANGTREAVDGFQLTPTNAERLGLISGIGAVGSLTWWALGDEHLTGDPGRMPPPTINLKKKPDLRKGLALTAYGSAIVADYDANQRGGADDPTTPASDGNPQSSLDVIQLGFDASYWHTRHVRLAIDYSAYLTKGAGSDGGLTRVPGNLNDGADADASSIHEITSRVQLWF